MTRVPYFLSLVVPRVVRWTVCVVAVAANGLAPVAEPASKTLRWVDKPVGRLGGTRAGRSRPSGCRVG